MKILLVENEWERQSIRTVLKNQFLIDIAKVLDEALYLGETNEYSLIVLHLDESGQNLNVIQKFRKNDIHTPILILSNKKSLEEKIAAIDAGADDYLSISISHLELLTHVKALARRSFTKQTSSLLQVDDLILDTMNKLVTRAGIVIQLRRKEFDLLEYFMRNPGRVITREMILNNVWVNAYEAYTNTIDVHIKYLRDRIDKPFGKRLIKTIHGFGYKLEGTLMRTVIPFALVGYFDFINNTCDIMSTICQS